MGAVIDEPLDPGYLGPLSPCKSDGGSSFVCIVFSFNISAIS
jgi:hypothetical protein